MKARIATSLSVIALATSLVSCAGSENSPNAHPASTAPVGTTEPEPTVTAGSIDVPLNQVNPQAVPTAVNMYTEQARPADSIADGPAKRAVLYVSGQIESYLAGGGAPTKPNCVEAVALGGLDDLEPGAQVGCTWEEDGSYTLFSDHPGDPNYPGGNFVLRHNSVKGFIE